MIKITSEGGNGSGTKITDTETGYEINRWAAGLDVSIKSADSPVTALVQLAMVELDIEAERVRYALYDPDTHQLREIAQIVFADGKTLDFSGNGAPRPLQDMNFDHAVKTLHHSIQFRTQAAIDACFDRDAGV
ncbi:MAG TPA: hypothetical protein VM639_24720 [Dongiaceae bacterium]|nr:hypothetical protein [Dongiaceae bacterium]